MVDGHSHADSRPVQQAQTHQRTQAQSTRAQAEFERSFHKIDDPTDTRHIAGALPYLWPAIPVFHVVTTMQNVWARLGLI